MSDYLNALVAPNEPILNVLGIIDRASQQIALVVDRDRRLIGTVTDGDIRRGLLRGVKLEEPIVCVMNSNPRAIAPNVPRDAMIELMTKLEIHQLPVVDAEGCVVGLERLDELIELSKAPVEDTWVVLMAGGRGTRLRAVTELLPKPMVTIGGRPLIETIIRGFVAQGFRRIFLSVNYKAEVVKAHCGDGGQFGASIQYIDEPEPRGTAGALALLAERPTRPIIVMNGDLMTAVNFRQLVDFHRHHGAAATMCVRAYSFKVPYGVVATQQHRLVALQEKPEHHFFVNAGIYVLDPAVIDLIPTSGQFDMTDLFEHVMAKRWETAAFPLREYWLDIGRMDDFERAQAEFEGAFLV